MPDDNERSEQEEKEDVAELVFSGQRVSKGHQRKNKDEEEK